MLLHGSPLEWVQFVVGLTGTILNSWAWWTARGDYQWACANSASEFHKMAGEATYAAETVNLMVACATLIAGITAVIAPPPPGVFTITAIWKLYALITISCLIALQGFRSRYYRKILIGMPPMNRRHQPEDRRMVGYDRRKGTDRRKKDGHVQP
jgi:hypothetical protein